MEISQLLITPLVWFQVNRQCTKSEQSYVRQIHSMLVLQATTSQAMEKILFFMTRESSENRAWYDDKAYKRVNSNF